MQNDDNDDDADLFSAEKLSIDEAEAEKLSTGWAGEKTKKQKTKNKQTNQPTNQPTKQKTAEDNMPWWKFSSTSAMYFVMSQSSWIRYITQTGNWLTDWLID